jgi:hypothetical protein
MRTKTVMLALVASAAMLTWTSDGTAGWRRRCGCYYPPPCYAPTYYVVCPAPWYVAGPPSYYLNPPVVIRPDGRGADQVPAQTLTSPKGRTYRLIPTQDRGNHAHDEPAPSLTGTADGEHFRGTARKAAKTSVANAAMETFADVKTLLGPLADDMTMRAKIQPGSPRVTEEKRNVTVQAFLYATKKETDNDFHLLLGPDPGAADPRYMTAEISGLPNPANPFTPTLTQARQQFKAFFGNHTLPGNNYVKFDPPVPVTVSGSLFFDIDHPPGDVGTGSTKPDTVWEIHPITNIVFEPD